MATILNITTSIDGFVAGPNASLDEPLGEGGEELHEWIIGLKSWREEHGLEGGESNDDDELVRRLHDRNGAFVMGRRMFSSGEGPWEDDPKRNGWWGDEPPFRAPVFVVTHHEREALHLGATTFTFVPSVEDAVRQAQDAAGGKDVQVSGGGSIAQQALDAGLLDELHLHVAPVLLGGGVRLFERPQRRPIELVGVSGSPNVTHLEYRVGG